MVRYFLALIVATLCLGQLSLAQEKKAPEPQRFSIGFKAGPSVTWGLFPEKTDREKFKSKPKLGYNAAFQIKFPLKDNYSYFAEAGFAKGGRRLEIIGNKFNVTNDQTFNLLQMNMGLRKSFNLNIAPNIPSKWFINVGPNVQYIISSKGKLLNIDPLTKKVVYKTEYKIQYSEPPQPPNIDLFTDYISGANRWLFGYDIGIGADAPINRRQRIFVELRFTSGQTFLGKKEGYSSLQTIYWQSKDLKSNLKTFSVTAAYTLDFDMRAMKMGKSTINKRLKKSS